MSNPVPDLLALTSIADGSQRLAAPLRNNYAAIQTAVNELIAALSGGAAGQVLNAVDGSHVQWAVASPGVYRKTTAKDVVNTVVETDLLNGEITIAAGEVGATGRLRVSLLCDYLNNTGGNAVLTFKIKFGGTTILDTTNAALGLAASATRRPMRIGFEIQNLGATNSQFMEGALFVGSAIGHTVGLGRISDDEGTSAGVVATAGQLVAPFSSVATAVDTTASCALAVTATHGSASPNLSMRLLAALVEVL